MVLDPVLVAVGLVVPKDTVTDDVGLVGVVEVVVPPVGLVEVNVPPVVGISVVGLPEGGVPGLVGGGSG